MEYSAYSHKGKLRKSNEDYYYVSQDDGISNDISYIPFIYIIADGMGGHNAGDFASRIAVEYISSHLAERYTDIKTSRDLISMLNKYIADANFRIYELSKSDPSFSGMGTTLTLAVIFEDRVYIAHVGDSRCYMVRDSTVKQITRDHSLVQELLDNGSITRDEMDVHPEKNVITRALGTDTTLKVDYFDEQLVDGDIILLCTDGLTNSIHIEDYITKLPKDTPMDDFVKHLGDEALKCDGSDDITIVAIRYFRKKEER